MQRLSHRPGSVGLLTAVVARALSCRPAPLADLAQKLKPATEISVGGGGKPPTPAQLRGTTTSNRAGELIVSVDGGDASQRRIELFYTPSVVITELDGSGKVTVGLRRASIGFEDMEECRFRVWAGRRWVTMQADSTSDMMDWINAFEEIGADFTEFVPRRESDTELQVEGAEGNNRL